MSLLPVAAAQARILALADALPVEEVPLAAAAGRWAAADVMAARTQPTADLSAMDGYAIRFADLPGPWRIIGEAAAGTRLDRPIAPGEAARIFTGAPLPDGADTVLVQEEAGREGDVLRLNGEGPPHQGAHVRPRGHDFAAGDVVLPAGARLSPPAIALAAIAGHGRLTVRRRARVALLSTGDELVPPGAPTPGVMLPASNAPMLAALLSDLPADMIDLGIVRDDRDALEAAFRAADADILVTTGGASVGDHDLVRPTLEAAGATLDFWRIAMKPGKPLMAGRLGEMVVVGLPGNPVSAFVTASLFVRPLIAAMAGAASPLPVPLTARLMAPLPPTGERAEYLRGVWQDGGVAPVVTQDSAALSALAAATLLIVRPPRAPAAKAGDAAEILPIA
jgi:molybdopterin molybdotransferase